MTFSLISVAVLLITALVIVIEVVRAINRGRKKTLVTLSSLFLTIFLSIFITGFLSNFLAGYVVSLIKSNVDISKFSDKLPSVDDILFAYSDALIAPIIFFLVFILVRIMIAIVMKIVYSVAKRKQGGILYENEDAPEYKKNPKLINALLGALCGFIVMVVCVSPIMGSLKIVTKTFKYTNEESALLNIKIKDSAIQYFDRCSNDFVCNVIYYCGGNLVYKSVASSNLNDNYFGLEREIDNTFSGAGDLISLNKTLNKIDSATEEEKTTVKELGNTVDKAETLKAATADILPVLAKKWLNDEAYEGLSKPKISKACETFFNKMLHVCKSSTPDTVGADLSTLLNVYLIAYENDILVSENYKEMIEKAKTTGAFDLIKKELSKNPRMANISLDIDTVGMKVIASALQSFNFENYDNLMTDITNVLNNAMSLDSQERLDYVKNLTRDYIQRYGIDIGDDVADEVAQRLVEELIEHRTSVTVDDLKAFWDKYSVKNENTSNSDTVISPTPVAPPQYGESESDIPLEDGTFEDDVILDESTAVDSENSEVGTDGFVEEEIDPGYYN